MNPGRLPWHTKNTQSRRRSLELGALALIGCSYIVVLPTSARAQEKFFACTFNSPTSGLYVDYRSCSSYADPIILGDKQLTLNGDDPVLYQLPNIGSGGITFEWQPIELTANDGYLNDVWTVKVDFTPDLAGSKTATVQGSFKYTMLVLDPDWVFATAELDSFKVGGGGGNVTVTKLLPTGFLSPDQALVSINGNNVDPVPFVEGITNIAVTDNFVLDKGTSKLLNTFGNSFTQKLGSGDIPQETEVPGPLPLLGISAAFGFSRRIRQRLVGARLH